MSRSAAGKVMRERRAMVFLAGAAAILVTLLVFAAEVSFETPTARAQTAQPSWQLNTQTGPDGTFSSAVGLSQGAFEVIEQRSVDPTGKEVIRKIPGKRTVSNIVLRKPLTSNQSFANWHQMMVDGQANTVRTNGSMVRLDGTGNPVATFNFTSGWPADYRVKTSGNALVEEVDLVVESLDRVP